MTEPVTSQTVRYVRCLWSLDRDLAYARHYPAVTWRHSFSLDGDTIANWHAAQGRVGWATPARGRSPCSPRPTDSRRSSSSWESRRCPRTSAS